jgi:hypothetical protein
MFAKAQSYVRRHRRRPRRCSRRLPSAELVDHADRRLGFVADDSDSPGGIILGCRRRTSAPSHAQRPTRTLLRSRRHSEQPRSGLLVAWHKSRVDPTVAAAMRYALACGRARGTVTEHGCEVIASPSARDDRSGRSLYVTRPGRPAVAGRVKPLTEDVRVGGSRAWTRGTLSARDHRRPRRPSPSPPSRSHSDQPRMRRPRGHQRARSERGAVRGTEPGLSHERRVPQ